MYSSNQSVLLESVAARKRKEIQFSISMQT